MHARMHARPARPARPHLFHAPAGEVHVGQAEQRPRVVALAGLVPPLQRSLVAAGGAVPVGVPAKGARGAGGGAGQGRGRGGSRRAGGRAGWCQVRPCAYHPATNGGDWRAGPLATTSCARVNTHASAHAHRPVKQISAAQGGLRVCCATQHMNRRLPVPPPPSFPKGVGVGGRGQRRCPPSLTCGPGVPWRRRRPPPPRA